MKRLLLACGLALALGVPMVAQPVGDIQGITIVDSGTACVTAPTACATYALDSQTGGLTLSVGGTWTGTLTFEGTNNGSLWTALLATNLATGAQASTTTASGLFTITNSGVIKVRLRATAAITGTAVITAAKGLGFARSSVFTGLLTTSVNGLATTSTDGLVLQNTTPATAGVPVQISPRQRLAGTAWDTAASQTVAFFTEVLPASAATPTGMWKLGYSLNGGAATYPFTVTSSGIGTFSANVVGGTITASSTFSVAGRNTLLAGTPSISSGFNTSPTLPGGICSNAFQVNTGATPATNTAVINMGSTAAAGWAVHVNDLSDTVNVSQVATTTTTISVKAYSKTTGVQTTWPASATLNFLALAY